MNEKKMVDGKNAGTSTITKLSGATRGMRFMQRKSENHSSVPATTAANESTSISSLSPSKVNVPQEETLNSSVPIIIASREDMYGLSARIIGRRSFNNFNKSVEDSWTTAYSLARQELKDGKLEKQHISDEELLKRYEKYVKGKGDMIDQKAKAIGNMNKKLKKRKRPSTED